MPACWESIKRQKSPLYSEQIEWVRRVDIQFHIEPRIHWSWPFTFSSPVVLRLNSLGGRRKGGTNTAIQHMVAREYRNTASKFSQIPKPQLQIGCANCNRTWKMSTNRRSLSKGSRCVGSRRSIFQRHWRSRSGCRPALLARDQTPLFVIKNSCLGRESNGWLPNLNAADLV